MKLQFHCMNIGQNIWHCLIDVSPVGEFIGIKCIFTNLDDPQGSIANCGDKILISGLRWYVCDWYRLVITVGGVGDVTKYCTAGTVYRNIFTPTD